MQYFSLSLCRIYWFVFIKHSQKFLSVFEQYLKLMSIPLAKILHFFLKSERDCGPTLGVPYIPFLGSRCKNGSSPMPGELRINNIHNNVDLFVGLAYQGEDIVLRFTTGYPRPSVTVRRPCIVLLDECW